MAKFKVYVTRDVGEEAINILKEAQCEVSVWTGPGAVPRETLLQNIQGVNGIFCLLTEKIDKELLDKASTSLKVISTMSVGYDHFDIAEIKKRGIKAGYTPGVLRDATAELTVALLLATSRRLFEANAAAKTGGWKTWAPYWMCGPGLKCATVGIVGLGSIGARVAHLLKAFDVKQILYTSRSKKENNLGAKQVCFDELLQESDFVVCTCALTKETKHLFNDDAFEKMKCSAVFINTSRGGIVDQCALVRALENKTIRAAGLDVTDPEPLPVDHPLFKMENCVILPHIGSAEDSTRREMAILTARNVVAGLNGEKMPAEIP